jgi:hypothetical protein
VFLPPPSWSSLLPPGPPSSLLLPLVHSLVTFCFTNGTAYEAINLDGHKSWQVVAQHDGISDESSLHLVPTGTQVTWPGSRDKLLPPCFNSRVEIGAWMAIDLGEHAEDTHIYNAARVAVRRIVKGLSLTGWDGETLKELEPSMHVLPLVDVQLVKYDTALVNSLKSTCMPSEATGADASDVLTSRLKLRAINQVFKDFLTESDGAVGVVGLTWSSEAILAYELLRENQVLAISPSATSPALTPLPWLARCTSHPSRANSVSCL